MNVIKIAAITASLILSAACTSKDYELISPTGKDETAALMQQKEREAREKELSVLKQYEQMDYRFFNGDAEAYQ